MRLVGIKAVGDNDVGGSARAVKPIPRSPASRAPPLRTQIRPLGPQNKLARDAAATRIAQLESEAEMLRERAASARATAATPAAVANAEAARRELDAAQRCISELDAGAAELQATNERLEREKRALRDQLDEVVSRRSGRASAEAAGNLRRALEAQRERDAAAQEAETLRRQFTRLRLEADVRAQQLAGQVDELQSQADTLAVWWPRTRASKRLSTVGGKGRR